MKWYLGRLPTVLVIAGLIALVGIAGVAIGRFREMTTAVEWVEHTRQVMNSVGRVLQAVTDAETGQRGYLITGDDIYLERYRKGVGAVKPGVARHPWKASHPFSHFPFFRTPAGCTSRPHEITGTVPRHGPPHHNNHGGAKVVPGRDAAAHDLGL